MEQLLEHKIFFFFSSRPIGLDEFHNKIKIPIVGKLHFPIGLFKNIDYIININHLFHHIGHDVIDFSFIHSTFHNHSFVCISCYFLMTVVQISPIFFYLICGSRGTWHIILWPSGHFCQFFFSMAQKNFKRRCIINKGKNVAC